MSGNVGVTVTNAATGRTFSDLGSVQNTEFICVSTPGPGTGLPGTLAVGESFDIPLEFTNTTDIPLDVPFMVEVMGPASAPNIVSTCCKARMNARNGGGRSSRP